VGEYLLNNCWVFDTSDDLDITAALSAGFDIPQGTAKTLDQRDGTGSCGGFGKTGFAGQMRGNGSVGIGKTNAILPTSRI